MQESELKKRLFVLLAAGMLVASAGRTLAQTPTPSPSPTTAPSPSPTTTQASPKVGFVYLTRILREAPVAQRAEKKLEQEFSKRNQDLAKMADQLKKLQENLEKNSVTLSDSERQRREREFADMNREFQRRQREFQEDLNQRRNEELSGVMQRVEQVVVQIATSEKFDLLFRDGQVVWSSPAIDITERVIKALEDKPAAK
jgi:outer membrane protein